MAVRKVRDAAEAAQLLRAMEASGMPLAEWARLQGVDGRSLNAWRLNLARRAAPELRLVELVPSAPPALAPESGSVVVRCGSFSVDVGPGFDDDVLRRVLTVVASC